jgi:SH3-like domain-containing protein
MKQLAVTAIIGSLFLLLIINNNEYRKYKTLNKSDVTTSNDNIVSLESTKTQIQASLDKTIVTLQVLKTENNRLKSELGIKKIAYLRPHDGIDYLSLQYGTKLQPSIGYMGSIKTLDFDGNPYTEVKVLETKEEWAKISIEAYIPKWYIVDKQDEEFKQEDIIHSIISKKMYIKQPGPMKLTPDINSFTQLNLQKGKAVYITKEYGDWYFIQLQQTLKDTDFTEGWVKKTQLGTSKEVVPSEAIIKKGTLIKEYYDSDESEERFINDDIPVYLMPEKNIGDYVYGKVSEDWGFWVSKRDIDFTYNLSK